MTRSFLFAAAIDNGCPVLSDGQRVDQMDLSGHYARWEEDFALARGLGVTALRYGPAYHRVHVAPGEYDWDTSDEPMRRLHALGVDVIADLCHHGLPPWLSGLQDPAFPVLFAEYARAFARRYPWVRYFSPVHELFVTARRSTLEGRWNDGQATDAAFVQAVRNLCMAHELAVEAILEERSDATIVQGEAAEHFHAAGVGAKRAAERWNALRLLPLDLTLGHEPAPGMARLLSDHGVSAGDLAFFRSRRAADSRWLGLTYRPAHEHRVASSGRLTMSRRGLGFRRIAAEYHQRYRLPIVHFGTSRESRFAATWLRGQWEDVLALRRAGVPVLGFTWDALTDRSPAAAAPSGGPAEPHSIGLLDLDRRPRSVGDAYRDLIARWGRVLDGPDEMQAEATA